MSSKMPTSRNARLPEDGEARQLASIERRGLPPPSMSHLLNLPVVDFTSSCGPQVVALISDSFREIQNVKQADCCLPMTICAF